MDRGMCAYKKLPWMYRSTYAAGFVCVKELLWQSLFTAFGAIVGFV